MLFKILKAYCLKVIIMYLSLEVHKCVYENYTFPSKITKKTQIFQIKWNVIMLGL